MQQQKPGDNGVPGTSQGQIPDPPITADVDVSGLVYFPLNVERLSHSELWAAGSNDEIGAALRLWVAAFRQRPAGSLPNDDRVLAAFAGRPANWDQVRERAMRGFRLHSDGRLYHSAVVEAAIGLWIKRKAERDRKREQRQAKAEVPPKPMMDKPVRGTSAAVPSCGGGGGKEKEKNTRLPTGPVCPLTGIDIPTFVDPVTWGHFCDHRRSKRARLTKHAAELIFGDLGALARLDRSYPKIALDHAIKNGHTGIFWKPDPRNAGTRAPGAPPAKPYTGPMCIRDPGHGPGTLSHKGNFYCADCYANVRSDERGDELKKLLMTDGPKDTSDIPRIGAITGRLSR